MIDFFVPTCARDLVQTRVLLRSLDTFLDAKAVHRLILAAVDTPAFAADFAALATHKLAGVTDKLQLGDLGLAGFDGSYDRGWDLQQVAKLSYARHSRSEFFAVLDAKNFALQPVGLADLVTDGRAPQILETQWIHHKWWRGSCWALQNKRFDRSDLRMLLSSSTPVVFHTATVRAMIDWMEAHHGESIERFFMRKRPIRHRLMRPTEFTLYQVWLDRERLQEKLHFPSTYLQDTTAQMWGGHGPVVWRERYQRIVSRQTRGLFTGIARPAWEFFDDAQRARLNDLVAGA